jgi:hypothetical protein
LVRKSIIEEEIKKKKEEIEKRSNIIETSNKFVVTVSNKFKNTIQSKILDNFFSKNETSEVSYIIQDSTINNLDQFEIIIYGLENLDKFKNYFNFTEGEFEVNPKLISWLSSSKSLEEIYKIAEKSKILDFYIDNLKNKIFYLGDDVHNKNFKKLFQIHLSYGEKFLKAQEENESIKQKINTLSNEITQMKDIKEKKEAKENLYGQSARFTKKK